MSDELPPMPPEARALLDAARTGERADGATRDEVYARLMRTIAPPGPDGGSRAAPPAASSGTFPVSFGPVVGVAVAAAVTVAVWTGARDRTPPALPPPTVIVRRAPGPSPLRLSPDASVVAVVEADASVAAAAVPTDAVSARTHAHDDTPDLEEDLAAEVALIDEARAALTRNDPSAVHDAARRHRHLAHHRLDVEMDALEVRAFVLAGDAPNAERAAERFHRRHPRSVLAASVDDAVRPMRGTRP